MPSSSLPLAIPSGKVGVLREAMRDLQVSIAEYQRASTDFAVDAAELARHVRSSAMFVQVVNELLYRQSGVQAAYRALVDDPADSSADIVKGFEYARHVTNHVAPIRVAPTAMVGGMHGYRTYATWEAVPDSVHERIKKATKPLRPYFDANLVGREVTDTLLNAARFFWVVCPDIVDRGADGEWTAFPLRHQPGVSSRLHPEEPDDESQAVAWLAARRPSGDYRVICGHLSSEEHGPVLFGLTFLGRCAFTPFFETADQVRADIDAGFQYFQADVGANTVDASARFDRGALCSPDAVENWLGAELTGAPEHPLDTMSGIDWELLWSLELPPNSQSYLTRRERRLNASAPPTPR